MALTLTVYAPTLTGGSLVVYETGVASTRLYPESLSSVARKVDLYTGRDALASAGLVRTILDNRDGLFSPDGVFAPRWREVALVAEVDSRVVFVGRAETTDESTVGAKASIGWRDLVDDLLAQQVEGVPSRIAGADVLASTTLVSAVDSLGLPTAGLPSLRLWLPERTTTIRRWLQPVLAALGWAIDWSASVTGGVLSTDFRLTHEDEFGNESGLPRFVDRHLDGDPKWDSGRAQVFNVWEGRRRFWDDVDLRFETEDVSALGRTATFSLPVLSREYFGDRKARLDLSQVREDRLTITGYMDDVINRRAWPHPRGTMKLRGPEAAALRIGDGFVTDFALGITGGRGLARTWRVQGRTVDLLTETTTLYCEMRDGRDADYAAWQTAGGTVVDAA